MPDAFRFLAFLLPLVLPALLGAQTDTAITRVASTSGASAVTARTLPPGTYVRVRGWTTSCIRATTVVGVLDGVVRDTLSLRIWTDFDDRKRPPAEPFAFALVDVRRLERAPDGKPLPAAAAPRRRFGSGSRTRWTSVKIPRDVLGKPGCSGASPAFAPVRD